MFSAIGHRAREHRLLFCEFELRVAIDKQRAVLQQEVQAMEGNRLLNTSVDDLVRYLNEKYKFQPPVLDAESISVDQEETQIDVRHDQDRYIHDRSRPFHVPGRRISFFVPFSGEGILFGAMPSTFTSSPPHGVVKGQELDLEYETTNHDADAIRNKFNHELAEIQQYLEWLRNDLRSFNEGLDGLARQAIDTRRERLLKDQGMAASLGVPLRRRSSSGTYSTPQVKRKLMPTLPKASVAPYVPEPALDMVEYEHILSVISNMVQVMERSPKAFHAMGEEDLRQHILVQLNGHYEGQATGETFNYEGKTDILIRVEGKNIFVGECKFWHGPAGLTETIDQLLGYLTYRDTKAAIVLFNRNKDFSKVLVQIGPTVESHPNFKHKPACVVENTYRCILRQRDDANREVILTVMAFDVPKV